MHYELGQDHERMLAPLQQFSHMKIDTSQESAMPVLYVAMATWIPKCNMYQEHEYVGGLALILLSVTGIYYCCKMCINFYDRDFSMAVWVSLCIDRSFLQNDFDMFPLFVK